MDFDFAIESLQFVLVKDGGGFDLGMKGQRITILMA